MDTETMQQPSIAIRAASLPQSVAFYTEAIGYPLLRHEPEADIAVIDVDGQPLLIAGSEAEAERYLAPEHRFLQRGIWRDGRDFEAEHGRLEAQGVTDFDLNEKPWGTREMVIRDPDGLTVTVRYEPQRTPDEVLAMYRAGVDELRTLTADLTDEQLDINREEDGWSIRQIVHHLTDGEVDSFPQIVRAAGDPGTAVFVVDLRQEVIAQESNYAARAIQPAVDLFCANRLYTLEMLRAIPDYAERHFLARQPGETEGGRPTTLLETLAGWLNHSLEHLYEIKTIREAHGL